MSASSQRALEEELAEERLRDAALALLQVAKIFLGRDIRYQVSVGGNPIAVTKMLTWVDDLVNHIEGKQP